MISKNEQKNKKGLFFAIEGNDGSGKTWHSKKIIEKLKKQGFKVYFFDFPQYNKESSYFVKKYLNGEYGNLKEVGPYKASPFYALDRFEASFEIKDKLNNGFIVVSNRYFASNMIHQGAKIKDKKEKLRFYRWIKNFEFKILEIPKPDLNILLYMPAKFSQKFASLSRKRKNYLKKDQKDIHEKDLNYLKKVEKTILEISQLFPKEFYFIKCVEKEKVLSKLEINKKIWQKINKILNAKYK